jgi:DNA-binding response OmpR family regulator
VRLLLVEDDEHVAAALLAVLGRHGIATTHARGGAEALERAQEEPFDVVLLDLGLPDMDGFEVCGQLRRAAGLPVIMVTARSDVRSRIHGLNLGADDYVVKPYDTGELLARIHAVSRRRTPPPGPVAEAGAAGRQVLRAGPVSSYVCPAWPSSCSPAGCWPSCSPRRGHRGRTPTRSPDDRRPT